MSNPDAAGTAGFAATAGGTLVALMEASVASNQVVFGTNQNAVLKLNRNSATVMSWAATTGACTLAAPASGIALTVNGSPGASAAALFAQAGAVEGVIDVTAIEGQRAGLRLSSGVTLGSASFDLYQAATTNEAQVINRHATGDLSLWTNAIRRLNIAGAAGNVTISAPASGTALTVTQFAGAIGLAVTAAAADAARTEIAGNGNVVGTSGFALIQDSSSVARLFNRANAAMDFSTNATTRMTIAAAGNVTIAAPSSGVHLSYTGTAATNLQFASATGSTTGAIFGDFVNTGGNLRVGVETSVGAVLVSGSAAYASVITTQTATSLVLGTNSGSRVTIASAGNVTINAPSSGVALTVTAFSGANAASFLSGPTRMQSTVVASLLAAATAGAGARAQVTDATVTTFASIVAGGGANGVPVYCDGTNWRIG